LRLPDFYREKRIELKLGARAVAIDPKTREAWLADGSRQRFGALLLATGAEPVRLGIPGSDLPHDHYLRTLADSRALIAAATAARRVVVIGASFIGLEVARRHCGRAGSRCMSWHPKRARWKQSLARKSETSCARSTRSTASRSTSVPPQCLSIQKL
jgi:NADH dehydrogenase FAD-containing subunit